MGGRGAKSTRAAGGAAATETPEEAAAAENSRRRDAYEPTGENIGQERTPQARATAASEAERLANAAEKRANAVEASANYYKENPTVRPRGLDVAFARNNEAGRASTYAKDAKRQSIKAGTEAAKVSADRAVTAAIRAENAADYIWSAFKTRQGPI